MDDAYTIVVGVDGSPAAKAALRWALWHSRLASGSVTAVMAWDYPPIYGWEVPGPEDLASTTARALTKTLEEVAAADNSTDVHKEVAQGHPARALLNTVEQIEADLLVVGNRGRGGFTSALLGSVSQHCVHHATCPVVVVRDRK